MAYAYSARSSCTIYHLDRLYFSAYELDVSVVSIPDGPQISAASSLALTCQVVGGSGVYFYQWSSTCTLDCFIAGQTTQSVTRDALRSTDSGNHTCAVSDDAGNSGSHSVLVSVTGKT